MVTALIGSKLARRSPIVALLLMELGINTLPEATDSACKSQISVIAQVSALVFDTQRGTRAYDATVSARRTLQTSAVAANCFRALGAATPIVVREENTARQPHAESHSSGGSENKALCRTSTDKTSTALQTTKTPVMANLDHRARAAKSNPSVAESNQTANATSLQTCGKQIVAIGKTQNTNATLTRRTNVGCRIERYAAQHQYIAQCSTKNAAGA